MVRGRRSAYATGMALPSSRAPLHSQTGTSSGYALIVWSQLQPAVVVARVKELLWSIDPDASVVEAGSIRDQRLESLHRRRCALRLSTAFAATPMQLAGAATALRRAGGVR